MAPRPPGSRPHLRCQEAGLKIGRRLMLFGPEGFREAPANYRLVIVMGADPSKFFAAMDQTLGSLSSVAVVQSNNAVQAKLLAAYRTLVAARENLHELQVQAAEELPRPPNP